jgi:hypothetical protein
MFTKEMRDYVKTCLNEELIVSELAKEFPELEGKIKELNKLAKIVVNVNDNLYSLFPKADLSRSETELTFPIDPEQGLYKEDSEVLCCVVRYFGHKGLRVRIQTQSWEESLEDNPAKKEDSEEKFEEVAPGILVGYIFLNLEESPQEIIPYSDSVFYQPRTLDKDESMNSPYHVYCSHDSDIDQDERQNYSKIR